ncbi:ABC-F family ATP-binding cassette domain-containing protein [Vallitalea okinawensis]|uniref:ABC-F family ATP-binding cassette domain-containing protein n=1 Tax=Vallitalea okinawensis TaxID=2078660 RepID=UPI000CFE3141|nr:ABC-F family ATP-binding cassette domain-containing protein [Vallitalea okinawensis]
MILSCKNIKKSFGIDEILTNVTFHLNQYDKVALVGINGAGKTTLFRIITKELTADEGRITLYQNASLGYLSQEQDLVSAHSIYEECETVFEDVIKTETQLREIESRMNELNGEALEQLMLTYSELQHQFESMNGYGYKSQITGVLKGLGFTVEELGKAINTLSGGQKSRVCLAKLLLRQPEVLLLDEPTNHLDIEAVTWLEEYLRNYKGTLLIISHDRYFLDKIVSKVIEIENKKSEVYSGNYSFYAKQKAINRDIQYKHYLEQQRDIKQQEAVIAKLRSFSREKSIKRAKSREKALDKVELLEKPTHINDEMRLVFQPKKVSGNDVLFAENLSKSYDHQLFDNVDLDIKRGDKIALIGANGIGKTTLFKIIMKHVPVDTGQITYGSRVQIGYYDQEHDSLSEDKTIFEELSDTYPKMTNGEIRNTLAAFLFTGEDVFKSILSLSGGEKGRVSLSKIMLSEANFLLMDEPTNHLDITSREVLENALSQYEGTLFFISHDRYFINKVATKVFELTPEKLIAYLGNYNDYVEKKEQLQKLKEKEVSLESISETSDSKQDWLKRKEYQAQTRKLQNLLESCEKDIHALEEAITSIDEALCLEENYTDPDKAGELHSNKIQQESLLEEKYLKWEEIQEKISELDN